MEMIVSLTDRFMLCVACSAAVLSVVVGHGNVDAADIFVFKILRHQINFDCIVFGQDVDATV